jgi:enamine deaminase RidA (YjgF/YER057c/UK114 family)
MRQILQPAGWARPRGYSNGIVARGRQVYIAGQIGWDSQGVFRTTSLAGQLKQVLQNIVAVLAEAGGRPEHIVRLTWYITDRGEYQANMAEIGAAYREVMGRNFPTMAVVQVVALVEPEAKIEIEATAVLPDEQS